MVAECACDCLCSPFGQHTCALSGRSPKMGSEKGLPVELSGIRENEKVTRALCRGFEPVRGAFGSCVVDLQNWPPQLRQHETSPVPAARER